MNGRPRNAGGRPFLAALQIIAAGTVLIPFLAIAETLQRQVQIEAKFVEITQNAANELGFDTRLAQKLGELPLAASNPTSPAALQFGFGPAPSANAISARLFPSDGAPGTLKVSGLLTQSQSQILLDDLFVEKSAKVISAPMVLTPIDQQAAAQVTSSFVFRDHGVKLDVTPRVGVDGSTIDLQLVPEVSEFPQTPPNVASNTTVSSGQTLVLGGFVAKASEPKQNLILFISPQITEVLSRAARGGADKDKVEAVGTGETIGHVADLKFQNLTDQSLNFVVPSLVLESKSAKNQDYTCPHEQSVALAPREMKTVPIDGVCANRDKPPVAKDVGGELVLNIFDPAVSQNPDCRIPAKSLSDLVRICSSIYDATDNLQKDGVLKDFPYQDKQKQKDILVQWGVWSDSRVCDIGKAFPATKEDLRNVVYKQIEQKGPASSDAKKKIDKGIDTIFGKIELVSANAKDLEQSAQSANRPTSILKSH
jgi:hypothetical protein